MRVLRAVAIALLALLAVGCAGGGESEEAAPPRAVTTRTSLTPTTHLFAEPVVAQLDVVVDSEAVDAGEVEVETDFEPYDVIAESRTQEGFGRLTRMRYEFTLRCLLIACIPEVLQSAAGEAETGRGERLTIRLPAAKVTYDDPQSGEPFVRNAAWPPLESVSRITASDVPSFGFAFKTSVTPLAEPTYRVSPTVLAAVLLAAALALLALPAWLVLGWARRRRPPPPAEKPELSPLERALVLVEWANQRENGAERREALEVLAVELEAVERAFVAERARALAWSLAAPSSVDADALIADVRGSDAD